jgi:acyl transferase domain-containing protein
MTNEATRDTGLDIAVIGYAGRFPGAKNVDEYWANLCAGVESISFFADDELIAAGVDPAVLRDQRYVKAAPVLDDVDMFDAQLFGYAPREARATDPQQRFFLECAWAALEHAGYDSAKYGGMIGVYGGAALNSYLLFSGLLAQFTQEYLLTLIGNDKDFLTTRVSYKLNLTGPSITIQTACSTSLVAVHIACQSLLNQECDIALAGGVAIRVPHRVGYFYQPGSVFSPDGHCRTFDARAAGTIFGSGVGIVVLKRLADALADGDCIHAVVKGTAINNDGASKIEFTAPSLVSQSEAIIEALAHAGVDAATISYVEAHGTGTPLGDPIEIAALTRAFRAFTDQCGFSAIGSAKPNIGHMDAAAGIAGLIKTILALKHRLLPPVLHYETPNPEIDFASTPFYVTTALAEWPAGAGPRRAGINSLGMGGTNAFLVLEEAPVVAASGASRPAQLLLLSAKTAPALETLTARLAAYLAQQPSISLADVAYTLQVGRKDLDYRRMAVCHDHADALRLLTTLDAERVVTAHHTPATRDIVFMCTGQGAQYVDMGRELYHSEPVFKAWIDRCAELLQPQLGRDLREMLYPTKDDGAATKDERRKTKDDGAATKDERRKTKDDASDSSFVLRPSSDAEGDLLNQTAYAQPALFVIEYALAQLWMSWGLRPAALIGHSLGEYVAACLAGVFTLPDALALVVARGQLMQALPGGAMLVVPLPEHELQPLLGAGCALAAVNGAALCVVSGKPAAVRALRSQLAHQNLDCRYLRTSHAFHSAMMDPMLTPFTERVGQIDLGLPTIPLISNVSGTWMTPEEATDPAYWARHVRQTVRFADGLHTLLQEPQRVLLEVGPHMLSSLALVHPARGSEHVILSSLHAPGGTQPDTAFLLNTLGRLWLAGVVIDWAGVYANERRQRVPLPAYPFQRQRYWVETTSDQPSTVASPPAADRQPLPTAFDMLVGVSDDAEALARIQTILAEVWQAALGIAQIDQDDDFFALGGTSILVTDVIARLNERFQIDLSALNLLESPTIALLSDCIAAIYRIERHSFTPAAAAAPPLPCAGDKQSAEGGLAGGEGNRS